MNHTKLSIILLLSLSGASVLAMQLSKEQIEANKALTENLKAHLKAKAGIELEEYTPPIAPATVTGQTADVNPLCLTGTIDLTNAYRVQNMQAAALTAQESLLKKQHEMTMAQLQKQKEEKLAQIKAHLDELKRRAVGKETASAGSNIQIELIDKELKKLEQQRADHQAANDALCKELASLNADIKKTHDEIVAAEKERKEKEQSNRGWFSWTTKKQ